MTTAQTLAKKYYTFSKMISKQYCRKIGFGITEDLESEGFVGLVKAANSYKPGRLTFKSWAAFKIRSEIQSSIKNNFRTKKGLARTNTTTISMDDTDALHEVFCNSIENKICNRNQLRKLMSFIPERCKEVIILHFFYGYRLREVGDMKGYTRANASRIKREAVETMLIEAEKDLRKEKGENGRLKLYL